MAGRRRGLLYALASSLAVSCASALVKFSSAPIGQTAFLVGGTACLTAFPYVRELPPVPWRRRISLGIYALLTGFVIIVNFQAVQFMPLADEVVVSYTSVAFTVILAWVFIKEPCGLCKLVSTALVLCGVCLTSEQGVERKSYPNYNLGWILTLSAAVFDAASYIFFNDVADLHPAAILLSFGFASILISGPLLLMEPWSIPVHPLILISTAVLIVLQEALIFLAIRSGEETSLVSLVQATDIVFSYIWEICFFKEQQTMLRLAGAGLVTAAVFLAAITSNFHEQSKPQGYDQIEQDEEAACLAPDRQPS